jgi:hypothetical protein
MIPHYKSLLMIVLSKNHTRVLFFSGDPSINCYKFWHSFTIEIQFLSFVHSSRQNMDQFIFASFTQGRADESKDFYEILNRLVPNSSVTIKILTDHGIIN